MLLQFPVRRRFSDVPQKSDFEQGSLEQSVMDIGSRVRRKKDMLSDESMRQGSPAEGRVRGEAAAAKGEGKLEQIKGIDSFLK